VEKNLIIKSNSNLTNTQPYPKSTPETLLLRFMQEPTTPNARVLLLLEGPHSVELLLVPLPWQLLRFFWHRKINVKPHMDMRNEPGRKT